MGVRVKRGDRVQCPACGQMFRSYGILGNSKSKRSYGRYCSWHCWKSTQEAPQHECRWCRRTYYKKWTERKEQMYCSVACYWAHRKSQGKEWSPEGAHRGARVYVGRDGARAPSEAQVEALLQEWGKEVLWKVRVGRWLVDFLVDQKVAILLGESTDLMEDATLEAHLELEHSLKVVRLEKAERQDASVRGVREDATDTWERILEEVFSKGEKDVTGRHV
jgi:hypothetical protein